MEDQSSAFTPSDQPRPKYTIQYTPAAQFGILVAMAFVGMIVGSILALVPFFVKGIPLTSLTSAILDPANAEIMRWSQIIGTFFQFLLPVWAFQKIVRTPKDFLHVKTKSDSKIWLMVAVLAFASLPVTDLMGTLNHALPIPTSLATTFQKMEDTYNNQVMQLMQMKGIPDLVISLVIVALLPAIFEETFFRGGLQQVLTQWAKKPFFAILITSVIFSAIHVSYYGFLPRAFLGVLLGYVYYWSKDLKLNILIHFINNAVSVVSFYLLAKNNELTPEKMNESLPWHYEIGGLALFVTVLFLLYRTFQKQNKNASQI